MNQRLLASCIICADRLEIILVLREGKLVGCSLFFSARRQVVVKEGFNPRAINNHDIYKLG